MARTILHIDASARRSGSTTRSLSEKVIAKLGAETVVHRDLTEALPQINEDWVSANFTPTADRSVAQREVLAQSDTLVDELKAADTLVIGLPIYNFSVPASFKAWIDLVARVGLTFQYGASGPKGLLSGKRAIVVIASGGTQLGSPIDFASGYVRHILGFMGITDVEFVAADRMAIDPEASQQAANDAIAALAA